MLACFAPKESNPFTSWIEEGLAISAVTIHCVPSLHFSARGIFDCNKTLWRGYVIEYPDGPVFFAGDTATGSHFAQIREKFYAPQLALLPIGAYEPRWFMSSVHMAPEEAVRAHRGPVAVWSPAVFKILGVEFAAITLILGVTLYLQSRKRNFI